ncbi:hypothetical protein D3C75_1014060 [compost metagenome]
MPERTPRISGCWAISTKISRMALGLRLNTFGALASMKPLRTWKRALSLRAGSGSVCSSSSSSRIWLTRSLSSAVAITMR